MITNVKNIIKWKNKTDTTYENLENMHHKIKKNNQKNHCMKYQLKDNNEYKKIIITENMTKSQAEKNASTISAENTIWKNEKHDENLKNQNIMWKRKDITDISIYKIQKKQKCVFSHDAWILK